VSPGEILYILWRRVWIVALTLIVASLVAVAVLLFAPPRYDAEATASIDPGSIDPVTDTATSPMSTSLVQGNLMSLVGSERVAVDVVKRLNLTANPAVQEQFRASSSFGRENIDDWMAETIGKNVLASFQLGTNVLSIKYKSTDPKQAALFANTFLAATIDETIAMKASAGDQTARWFAPQLDDLRRELEKARSALQQFQSRTNVVAPSQTSADTESAALAAVTADLATSRGLLTALQSRLASGSSDPAIDPSDPDLQMINGLKDKISSAQAEIEAVKNSLGPNNPKMVSAAANLATLRRQLADASEKSRTHLKEKIATTQGQIASLEIGQAQAQKTLIAAQAQRDRLADLQRDVVFKLDELNARERVASQARLQSKLTFGDISPLDKAIAPLSPAFPKPMLILPAAVGGGLVLGMILALIAEAMDRRIRSPGDFGGATSAPMLGVIEATRGRRALGGPRRGKLLPAG
jgi:succinoglycan biosynthesis transport protein ExoP